MAEEKCEEKTGKREIHQPASKGESRKRNKWVKVYRYGRKVRKRGKKKEYTEDRQ